MYLYKTIVRPLYMYANAAWANIANKRFQKDTEKRNKAIRLANNLPVWTSVDEIHQIGNVETVSETIQNLI